MSVLTGGQVHLSDLFDGLLPGQDCEIGPAPEPGKRLTIQAAQIGAIASQRGGPGFLDRGLSYRPA
ncbi:hypothetical protein LOC54_11625 [Acetobacter sp. AN02]|uniref:hypothetical protein n=1 Tax=Acetobacter sp. AN02 TaxID=2894186 RepID=UPI0024346564|nr:hypothetical protein [Acetobacter sp. AN02]MDG6095722.1 hypothetical protein [Acetobacter sp. AN02]